MLGHRHTGAKRLAVALFSATTEPACVLSEHSKSRQPVKGLAGFSFYQWRLDTVVKAHGPLWPPHSKERRQSPEVGANLHTASPDRVVKKAGFHWGPMPIAAGHNTCPAVFPLP